MKEPKNKTDYLKEGNKCPHCMKNDFVPTGLLEMIPASEPFSDTHLMCNRCDSTYGLFQKV